MEMLIKPTIKKKLFECAQDKMIQRNKFIPILSINYGPIERPYYEKLFIAKCSNDERLIVLYEDHYCLGEIMLFFEMRNGQMTLYDFGNLERPGPTMPAIELFDRPNNYFINKLMHATGAYLFQEQQPENFDEYLVFFKKIYDDHYINVIKKMLKSCGIIHDIENIVLIYLGLIHK
jgi:hypothetical protein